MLKTIKLLIGGASVIAFFAIFAQSCIVADKPTDMSASVGLIMGFSVLFAGLIAATMRKSRIGGFAAGALYVLAAVLGYINMAAQPDLKLWAIGATVCGVIILAISTFTRPELVYGQKPTFKKKDYKD